MMTCESALRETWAQAGYDGIARLGGSSLDRRVRRDEAQAADRGARRHHGRDRPRLSRHAGAVRFRPAATDTIRCRSGAAKPPITVIIAGSRCSTRRMSSMRTLTASLDKIVDDMGQEVATTRETTRSRGSVAFRSLLPPQRRRMTLGSAGGRGAPAADTRSRITRHINSAWIFCPASVSACVFCWVMTRCA